MEFIRLRIVDRTMIELVEKFLKAGCVDNGKLIMTDLETPQGNIVSPMLANIFLRYVLGHVVRDDSENTWARVR